MNERVLDTSVLIAILRSERFDLVDPSIVDGAVMSSVNVEETLNKSVEYGIPSIDVEALLSALDRIEPYTEQQARLSASLRPKTQKNGIGLGDRSCLALGILLEADVYTAEYAWAALDVGCSIHLIRTKDLSCASERRQKKSVQ